MDSLPFELANAIRAKNDYWGMGMGRTLKKLLAQYKREDDPPTIEMSVLEDWADKYEWEAFCAEREARDAEKTEAMQADGRVQKKAKRIRIQDEILALCDVQLQQLKVFVTGMRRDVVATVKSCDPNTGEPVYSYSVEWVPNLTPAQYVAMYPKVMSVAIEIMKLQKSELGDETSRFHVTIEQVVNALPAPLQAPMREALYEELMRPKGVEMASGD